MPTTLTNVDQAEAWDGEEGQYWVDHEEHYNAGTRPHGERLLAAMEIAADHCVLDIGCGCGESTRQAARLASAGQALGLDLSSGMLARARSRAREEGLANVRFEQGDAQVYAFEEAGFDRAISRFGVMFFEDPSAAFANIRGALRPGGRLGLLTWRELRHNPWICEQRQALAAGRTLPEPRVGAPGPFGLADARAVRRLLEGAGFVDIDLSEVREPVCLGTDVDDAFAFARGTAGVQAALEDLRPARRRHALDALRRTLARHQTAEGVRLDSSAWLVTARCA